MAYEKSLKTVSADICSRIDQAHILSGEWKSISVSIFVAAKSR